MPPHALENYKHTFRFNVPLLENDLKLCNEELSWNQTLDCPNTLFYFEILFGHK